MQSYYYGEEEYNRQTGRTTSSHQNVPPRHGVPLNRPARKRRKKRMNRYLLWTLLFVSIAAVFGIVYFAFFYKSEKIIPFEQTSIRQGMSKLNTGSGMLYQSVLQTETGTETEFHYYDWNKSSRNYSYRLAGPDFRMNGSNGISVVYNQSDLQIVGSQDKTPLNGEILTVECGTDHIGVLRKDSAGGESILILSRSGEPIDQLLADNQYIVNFGFYSTTSEMMWMETLSVSAGIPITTITTYDLTKRTTTGVMEIHEQLVDGLYFTNSSIFVVGTNQIIRYTTESKETYKEMIYGYKVIDFSAASGTPTFLLAPREGNMNSINVMTLAESDSSNVSSTFLQLPGEGIAGNIMNGSLVVVTENNAYTYTLKGKLSDTAKLEMPVTEAIKVTDSKMLVANDGTYYVAKVR